MYRATYFIYFRANITGMLKLPLKCILANPTVYKTTRNSLHDSPCISYGMQRLDKSASAFNILSNDDALNTTHNSGYKSYTSLISLLHVGYLITSSRNRCLPRF